MAQLPVTIVQDITTAAGEVRHSGCTKAVLSEHDAEQSAVFHLSPGGVIQSHLHSRVFDLFIGVSGCADITYEGQQGNGEHQLIPECECLDSPIEDSNLTLDRFVSLLLCLVDPPAFCGVHGRRTGGHAAISLLIGEAPAQILNFTQRCEPCIPHAEQGHCA